LQGYRALVKLEIRVASGPKAGKTIMLTNGELTFGRTKGDIIIDWDPSTSSRHFKIEKQIDGFFVQDVGSTYGTFLNGSPVKSAQLADGDKIIAGNTLFTVHFATTDSPETHSAISQATITQTNSVDESARFDPYRPYNTTPFDAKPVEVPARQEVAIRAIRSICPSGMVRLHGDVGNDEVVTQIAAKLLETPNLLIVDFSRLGMQVPPEVNIYKSSPFVHHFIDAVEFLPLVLATSELPNWEQKLEVGWSKDAAIILRSDMEKAALIEALEKLACVADDTNSIGISGICWPSVLSCILFANPGGIGSSLMNLVTAAFFAGPDSKEQWQLYANETMIGELSSRGVIQIENHPSFQSSV
jgi:pSer/pThr/pTyr-binding forkhead associated (FHA) protein